MDVNPYIEFLMRAIAQQYALKDTEVVPYWTPSWELYLRIVGNARASGASEKKKAERKVDEAYGALKAIVRGADNGGVKHLRRVQSRPQKGRYVVFSDHHITFDGHRQNQFAKNAKLYADALAHYLADDFILVENGDVEELVIYEPNVDYGHGAGAEPDLRRTMTRPELYKRRRDARKIQLELILGDHDLTPVKAAWREFCNAKDADGRPRMVRIAGNHDYDLQRDSYHQLYRDVGIKLPEVIDVLRLTADGVAPWLVIHGHQIDTASNPEIAPSQGETISECVGLFFQGADRTWSTHDTAAWRNGMDSFNNELVDDEAKGLALGKRFDEFFFEAIFQHNVAWEYFDAADDAARAVAEEVLTGARFFKFRHTDERRLWRWMARFAKARRPRMVLGHTHEVRSEARRRGGLAEGYYNSGSAGRFENLVWGLEVVDGVATVISWSHDAAGEAKRREWKPADEGQGSNRRRVLRS